MRPAVREAFFDWTVQHEGAVRWLYLDVYGLPTTAVGNLLSTPAESTMLPWRRPDGTPAGRDEIVADWAAVKAAWCGQKRDDLACAWKGSGRVCLAHQGHLAAKGIARLRLDDEGVRGVVNRRLAMNDGMMQNTFETWETWPADAQLATHSMCWAAGPGFTRIFPKLAAALRAQDFRTAAVEAKLREAGNPGVIGRNRQVHQLYRNAHVVRVAGFSPEPLYFPRDLIAEADGADTQPETVPARPEREQIYVASNEVFEALNPTGPKR